MYRVSRFLFASNRWVQRLLALLHALWMVGLSLTLMNRSVTYGDEALILKWISILERVIFEESDKPDPSEYLFINIAYDTQPVPHYSEAGLPIGQEHVTNRSHLAAVFSMLADSGSRHRYVVCDITFEDSLPAEDAWADTLLGEALAHLPRAVFPTHHTGDSAQPFVQGIFPVQTALADYIPDPDGNFLKYRYVDDGRTTLPLHLLSVLDTLTPRRVGPFHWLKGHLWLRNFIPEMRLRNYDLFPTPGSVPLPDDSTEGAQPYVVYPLAEMVELADLLGPEGFHAFTENRMVVIGDFNSNDVHETFYGPMGGTIILLNAYLSLKHGDNLLSWWFILLMLLVYYRLSKMLLDHTNSRGHAPVVRFYKYGVGKVVVWIIAGALRTYLAILETVEEVFSPEVLSRQQLLDVPSRMVIAKLIVARGEMVLLLTLYFVIAFFGFNKPVNFVLLIIYISLVDFLLRHLRYKYRQRKALHTQSAA